MPLLGLGLGLGMGRAGGAGATPLSLIANDAFTDTDTTDLSAHVSDSGHSWSMVTGIIEINSNIADVISTIGNVYHYSLDLSAELKQPKQITVDIKNTNATEQRASICIRDDGTGNNLVYCYAFAAAGGILVNITEIVAGVATSKAQAVVIGDYRDNINFFPFIVTDTGTSITVDLTSVVAGLTATWSGVSAPTSKSVGLYSSSFVDPPILSTLYDNLLVRA